MKQMETKITRPYLIRVSTQRADRVWVQVDELWVLPGDEIPASTLAREIQRTLRRAEVRFGAGATQAAVEAA